MSAATEAWLALPEGSRDEQIAHLIGGQLIHNYHLALDGEILWRILTPADIEAERKAIASWQRNDREWKSWRKITPSIDDDWRGRLTIIDVPYALRYSGTPGGGWVVVDHLARQGFAVSVTNVADGVSWLVLVTQKDGLRTVSHQSPTMAVAACLVAIDALQPATSFEP